MENAWMMLASLLVVTVLLTGCVAKEQRLAESQPGPADAAPAAGQIPAEEGSAAPPIAEEQPAEPPLEPVQKAPADPVPKVKEFHVEVFRFGFDPTVIEANRGDIVRITAVSTDVAHGLALPEYGINLRLEPGVEQVAEFVADTPGEFTFYCSVPCGSGHSGMRGTLKVS